MATVEEARAILQRDRLEPLWSRELLPPLARGRVLRFLAWKLELEVEEADVEAFTLEQCRAAWIALQGVRYPDVREWASRYRAPAKAGAAQP